MSRALWPALDRRFARRVRARAAADDTMGTAGAERRLDGLCRTVLAPARPWLGYRAHRTADEGSTRRLLAAGRELPL